MTRRLSICAVIALLWLASRGSAAEDPGANPGGQTQDNQVFADLRARADGDPVLICEPERFSACDLRFGWWAAWSTGSPVKTGEYESWQSSPFFDVDAITSDGTRTLDVTATGTDQETDRAKAYYYQPGLSADVDYNRFIHQLEHDPLNNMANPGDTSSTPAQTTAAPGPLVIKQDLGAGQDYAVRVQEFKGTFKADIDDGLRVRLDVWGMQRDGVRQVNAIAMCFQQTDGGTPNPPAPPGHPALTAFSGERCHVLSMPQQINWASTEIKPVIELNLGNSWVVEYSRPMRGFTADDQTTSRFYNTTGNITYSGSNPSAYQFAAAPSNYTQMDQLKISGDLTDETRAYAFMMIGNTLDEDIAMWRCFNDMDFRLTNTSIENVKLTAYSKIHNDDEAPPTAANAGAAQAPAGGINTNYESGTASFADQLVHPIDYHEATAGLKGVWRPWGTGFGLGGLAVVADYDYRDLQRDYALFPTVTQNIPTASTTFALFDEQHTITNSFQIGPDVRWSPQFDTYLHYKFQEADQPLIGLNSSNTALTKALAGYPATYRFAALSNITNTLLPTSDNIVEVGCNLMTSDRFLLNASVGIEEADNHSQYANFSEQNFPFNINAWYAVSQRFSLSGGYMLYSNFVGQTISLADQSFYQSSTATPTVAQPSSGLWSYGGQSQVFNLGFRYCATERLRLTGTLEYVLGHDVISNSAMQVATANSSGVVSATTGTTLVTDLGSYSEVENRTTRLKLGIDYQLRPRVVIYARYEFYEFLDQEPGWDSGTAEGIMGGFSAIF